MAQIVLIPGLWLDAGSWDAVASELTTAGHTPVPLTLPGLASRATDRSGIHLADHVDAVVTAIDAAPPDEDVVLVGHSMGAGIAHLAVDARPERVRRALHIGGFPPTPGEPLAAGFAVEGADLPLPDLTTFDDADVADLDAEARADFVARAVPSPASLTTDPVVLADDHRFAVPATMVCPEYTPEDLRAWVAGGLLPELAALTDVSYVDIASGHWPQFTRPSELAAVIVEGVGA